MAKLEKTVTGEFGENLEKIESGIMSGSISATLEDKSDFVCGNNKCSVRVFERYSYTGGNRLSLNVTLFQSDDKKIHLSAITSGGSNAVFFKFNKFGERAFLDELEKII